MTTEFLDYLGELERERPVVELRSVIDEAGDPRKVAMITVDLVKGFCTIGPLASPRIQAVVPAAARILTRAHELGVRDFFFPQDHHPENSHEFRAFPPHCVAGTEEAEMVDELAGLPFSHLFHVLTKRSISSHHGTDLHDRLARGGFTRMIAMGDCSDICLYQLALSLRTRANAEHYPWEIVVPAAAVQTYDLPVARARELGAMPHDGDLLHQVFLYHLQLNGVRVVADLV